MMPAKILTSRSQRGFTLIEIMIALTLGLILTGGAIYMFLANQQTYRLTNAVGRMQEAGRVALALITDDLRMAGNMGCAVGRARSDGQRGAGATGPLRDCRTGACQNVAPGSLPMVQALDANSDGTIDTLAIRSGSTSAIDLANTEPDGNNTLTFATASGLNAGDTALITNSGCTRAYLFTVGAVTTNQITVTPTNTSFVGKVTNPNTPPASLLRFTNAATLYWVGQTGTTTEAGDAIWALYRSSTPDIDLFPDANDDELVRGVGYMHVQFGTIATCTNGGDPATWRYQNWTTVPAPQTIDSVRIGLLVHSAERVREQADQTTYTVAGQTVAPAGGSTTGPTYAVDTRLHNVFATTTLLRNRARCQPSP